MNAIPKLQPVSVLPIQRPKFDNRKLGRELHWIHDNAATLTRYWVELCGVTGDPKDDDKTMQIWLRIQHDLEMEYAQASQGGSC